MNPDTEPSKETRGGGREGSEVVLVVEDEATVRAPICRTLRYRGYFVLEASNGEDALQVMQEYGAPVHCVVTDVMMPEMQGPELIEMLRNWYPQTRVVFISGLPAHLSGVDYEAIGGAAFLSKPFSLATLADTVRALLDKPFEVGDSKIG